MSGNKMQRLTGWEVMEDRLGNVHTSGVPSDPIVRHYPIDLVERAPLEVVVESVYYTDEDDRNAVTKNNQRTLMVDVRTLGQFSRQARWIPVLQRAQGLWDEDLYIPRPTKLDIDGNDLSTGSAAKGDKKPTPAESMDGDRGLLFFLENNPAKPIFLPYSQGHPKTNSPRKAADGRVRRIRHAGVLMEWSEDGNWTLDATEAAEQELDSSGDEQANNGTAGIITLKTKDGGGAELHLVLDENGNVELQDGGGTEKLTMIKASKLAELTAGTKITLDAGATLELKAGASMQTTAPTQTNMASISFALTSPVQTFTAAASFTVTAPSVLLGSAAALPLVKHTPWLGVWNALLAELNSQNAKYDPSNPARPPKADDVNDYYNLIVKLMAVASGFAATTTLLTKAS